MAAPAQVEFHTGVADPLVFACRLIRKALRSGARLTVTAPSERLAALDQALWTFDAGSFVPHVRVPGADRSLLARTPVWLVQGAMPDDAPALLLNLGGPAPQSADRFARVIEIVADDEHDAREARERWRHYEQWGVAPRHHRAGSSES